MDHPNLGTCLDSFHILSRDWDTAPIEAFNPDKIFFVQVADAPKLSMDVLSWSRHYRVFPGEGAVRARQVHGPRGPGRLHRAGVAGGLQRRLPPVGRRTHRRGRHALADLAGGTERQVARGQRPRGAAGGAGTVAGGPAAPARRRYPMELATLPQVAEPAGFNFAEVRAADTAGLETVLGQLGFEFNGRHRTKDVQLWTMGHARVIINEQAPGAGDALGRRHPAIAALGFDVDSPVIASARAQQLKAPAVPRKSQANEEVFQGFAAPDSTEIFLCQGSPDGTAAWTREFGEGLGSPVAGGRSRRDRPRQPGPAVAALRRGRPLLHQRPGPGAAAVRGGAEPQRTGPLPGDAHRRPGRAAGAEPGAAHPAGRCRRTATGRPTRSTSRSPWTTWWPPPGLHGTADWTSCRSRRTTTRTWTPGSAWTPDFLATLQELNLLYDRDADGEFLHFYTATVGSVFFEMVERRGRLRRLRGAQRPVRHAVQYDHLHRP